LHIAVTYAAAGALSIVLSRFSRLWWRMLDELKPASPDDVADALAFALRYSGRKRVHDSAEIMSGIVARRLVEHLNRCGFVLMRKPAMEGHSALGQGHREPKSSP
jgi:hypothetical protein